MSATLWDTISPHEIEMASRSINSGQLEGTFEYIEAKIRRDAEGTAFGDFESNT